MVKITYNPHAEMKIRERGINKRVIEHALANPDRIVSGFYGRTISRS